MANIIIAIDAMGGDFGPKVTIPACIEVLKNHSDLKLILVGDTETIKEALAANHMNENENLEIRHTTQLVAMDESPSHALRSKKDSSMRVAVDLVKEGAAMACVSAGNTGALMATARFVLKTLPGVDRPALMASLPTVDPNKEVRVLDLGANVDSSAENLYQFAVMGSVVTTAIDNISNPKVGLLNIGAEEIKGTEQVKQTAQLLSESKVVNYSGFIEADSIFSGSVDVVVCDGFVGNVALKASEGVAKLVVHYMKQAFGQNWWTQFVASLAKPLLQIINKEMDPGRRNGASLLGLQGIVIKSHGGANVRAYAHAVEEAIRQVKKNIPERIHQKVEIALRETTSSLTKNN